MATRSKKQTPVVDAEVVEGATTTTTTRTRRARRTTTPAPKPKVERTRKAADEIAAEAEAELKGGTPSVPQKRINENGEVNIANLSPQSLAYYKDIASSLNEKDLTSISTYGSDLQHAMDTYSSDFLTQSFSRENSLESADLIANLLGELHEVDWCCQEIPPQDSWSQETCYFR